MTAIFTLRIGADRSLRLIDESDATELYGLTAANRKFLAPWMPWSHTQTLEGTLEFIRASRKQLETNQGLQAAIMDRGAIIGVIGFHHLDRQNRLPALDTGSPRLRKDGALSPAQRARSSIMRLTFGVSTVWRSALRS